MSSVLINCGGSITVVRPSFHMEGQGSNPVSPHQLEIEQNTNAGGIILKGQRKLSR